MTDTATWHLAVLASGRLCVFRAAETLQPDPLGFIDVEQPTWIEPEIDEKGILRTLRLKPWWVPKAEVCTALRLRVGEIAFLGPPSERVAEDVAALWRTVQVAPAGALEQLDRPNNRLSGRAT